MQLVFTTSGGVCMGKEIKVKSIAFNVEDPLQKRIYEHVQQFSNFSFYMKSLIQRDMEGVLITPIPHVQETTLQLDSKMLGNLI